MKEYDPTLSVRVPRDLIEKLDKVVSQNGASRAEIVERCLYVGLSDVTELMKALETPAYGGLVRFATHRNVVKLMAFLCGDEYEIDETIQKVRNATLKRKLAQKLIANQLVRLILVEREIEL